MKNKRILKGSMACILAVGTIMGGALSASAVSNTYEDTAYIQNARSVSERQLSLYSVYNKSVYSYTRKQVSVRGTKLSVSGIVINGINYIPFRTAANAAGASYSYNSKTKTSTMKLSGLTVSATAGNYVVYANDRPLFTMSPVVIMSDGRMYIPATSFSKALGLSLSSDSSSLKLSGSISPLVQASKYYREDEVFWLARIIHAESSGEPLLGKIAVGNVVLNRVRSAYYPNTIYGVIFDRKYGVQFSPVANGAIYNTPSYASYLAAKICLEGYDVSEGAFFFLRPELSSSSWIPDSRTYVFSIGKHDFYK